MRGPLGILLHYTEYPQDKVVAAQTHSLPDFWGLRPSVKITCPPVTCQSFSHPSVEGARPHPRSGQFPLFGLRQRLRIPPFKHMALWGQSASTSISPATGEPPEGEPVGFISEPPALPSTVAGLREQARSRKCVQAALRADAIREVLYFLQDCSASSSEVFSDPPRWNRCLP